MLNRKKHNERYHFLIGMSRRELIKALGEHFHFYSDDQWIYFLSKNTWGRKTFLVIVFTEDMITSVTVRKTYGNGKE